jgi:glycolate oxidase FAD binding subunit
MKNVTGYDLVKLMAGAHGTLGVLSEVSFKVLPRPETQASVMIYGPDGRQAVAMMARALGSPFEVTGAWHSSRNEAGYPVTILRAEGFAASVAYRVERLKSLIAPMIADQSSHEITVMRDAPEVARQWRSICDLDEQDGTPFELWKISTKPSDAPGLVAKLPDGARYMFDWGGGLIWVISEATGTDLRPILGQFGGHATLVRSQATSGVARFQPKPGPIARLSTGLRQKFDPRGILNPGLMG